LAIAEPFVHIKEIRKEIGKDVVITRLGLKGEEKSID